METAPAPLPTPTTQVSNTGIQSTEIPISELPPEMIKPRSKKKKFIIMGIVAAVIILFVVLVIIMMQLSKPAPKPAPKVVPTPTKAVSTILPVDTSRNDTILVTGVPHFLDMKPSDLPNVYDVRGVFNYKQNLIIVSTSGIVEFDPRTNEIIRQNDSRLFRCMKYATVIGTTLYVSCTQPPGIYGINLENGKLEKVYTEGSTLLSYATVSSVNDTLWVGGKNTVVKINTKDDAMQEYAPKDLGMPDCQYFMVHSYRENTWVTCVSPTIAGVSLYNEKDNTWTPHIPENQTNPIYTLGYNTKKLYFLSYETTPTLYTYDVATKAWESSPSTLQIPSSKPLAEEIRAQLGTDIIFPGLEQKGIAYLSYYDTVQKKVIDLELVLSDYIGLSDNINEKRYLFTRNAIDTLKDKEFPKAFKKLLSPVGLGTKLYVDPFENYAVLIGSNSAGTPPFTASLVQIKNGIVTNLLQDNKSLEDIPPEVFSKFVTTLEKTRLFGTAKGATMVDGTTGKTILEIDFPEKTLTFSEY